MLKIQKPKAISNPNIIITESNLSKKAGNTTDAIDTNPKSEDISDIFSICFLLSLYDIFIGLVWQEFVWYIYPKLV